jgi:L-lactate dehydrogenase complex protein LldE
MATGVSDLSRVFARQIADRKIEEIARSGVDVVTGGDTSCLMHLGTRLSAIGSKVRAVHFAELLAGEEASR